MNKDILVSKILDWNYFYLKRKKKFYKAQRKVFENKISDSNNYLSYEIANNKIKKLVLAEFCDTPFEYDRIKINCFYFSEDRENKKNILEEIFLMRKFFYPKKLNISLNLPYYMQKIQLILQEMNFKKTGTMFIGNVNQSFNKIKDLNIVSLGSDLKLRPFNYSKDSKKIFALDYKAHKNDSTSILNRLTLDQHYQFLKNYLKQVSKERLGLILSHKDVDIGFIGCFIRNDAFSCGHMVSVSIDKKHRGKGFSKYAYKELFSLLKKKRVRQYIGYSNTTQVLNFSSYLEREPCFYSFKLDRKVTIK